VTDTLASHLASPTPTPTRSADLRAEPAVSLCETLDRVLTKGVVAKGDITISVAGVALIYVGLGALVSSVESARTFVRTDPLPSSAGDDQ